VNRDGCRTPMQWNESETAGFCPTGVRPWLPVHENRRWANVQTQLQQKDSLLNVYRALLRLRRESEALQRGVVELVDTSRAGMHMLGYRRTHRDEALLVLINFGDTPQRFRDETAHKHVRFAIGGADLKGDSIELAPCSGAIIGDRT
jgi:alpha-glucosidase